MKKIKKIYFFLVLSLTNTFFKGPRFFRVKWFMYNLVGFEIGNNTKIVGPIKIGSEARVYIGEECWIGRDFKVDGNGIVIIGDRCDLAPEVMISTGSHKIGNKYRRAGKGINYETKIGTASWIGCRSTIIQGSNIGERCIVGAGALINKNVENDTMVAGIPAKKLKDLS